MYLLNSEKFLEKEREYDRINRELVNSQDFYNGRMTDDRFQKLLQALIDKPITNA